MKASTNNHRNAWGYFVVIGQIPKDAKPQEWCLHHIDTTLKYTDPARYNEWRVEDLLPMRMQDHTALHWKDKAAAKLRAKKIGDAHRGKPGHKVSEETKAKLSAKNKGHKVSEETRRKISEKCKGRKIPEDEIKRRVATYKLRHPKKEKPPKILKTKDEKGLYWITDGINNTRIVKDAPIPDGWHKGRAHMTYKTKPGPKQHDL